MPFHWISATRRGGFLSAQASTTDPSVKTRIDWGDGTVQFRANNTDTDGDGVFDTLVIGHSYDAPGNYNVRINDNRNIAAIYGEATTGVDIRTNPRAGGSNAADLVVGSALDDTIRSYEGADLIDGGAGNDIINAGNEDLFGDIVHGGAGDDVIFAYSAINVSDELYGEDGNDVLAGGTGNGILSGGTGNDLLVGGPDSDTLIGGLGSDRMTGNSRATNDTSDRELAHDFFVFSPETIGIGDRDTIIDFSSTEGDKIDLSSFSGEFSFIEMNRFSGAGMEVRSVTFTSGAVNNTVLSLDVDGDRQPDMLIVLRGVDHVTYNDFIL